MTGPGPGGRLLPAAFFRRDPVVVAPELLGKVLVHGERAGRIVEAEAYRSHDDPASHAHRGPTPRNASMFGPPGRLYVYFTYGMHWCANVVAHEPGAAGAVLVRALAPLRGIEAMRVDRPAARRDVDLANGPAKLCQALAIDGSHDGTDLRRRAGPHLLDDGTPPPARPVLGPRVGISTAVDVHWRFSVAGDPHRSRPW